MDRIFISLKCNLFWSWYGWKMAHLALNNVQQKTTVHNIYTFINILVLSSFYLTSICKHMSIFTPQRLRLQTYSVRRSDFYICLLLVFTTWILSLTKGVKPLIHQSELRTYMKVVPFKVKSSFQFVVLWKLLNGIEFSIDIKQSIVNATNYTVAKSFIIILEHTKILDIHHNCL